MTGKPGKSRFPWGKAVPTPVRERRAAIRTSCARPPQMPGHEHGLPAGHRTVGHVQPLDQLRALGHRHHQFLAAEQRANPVGQAVLADGVEGLRQFVPAFVDTVAAGLGVGLALGCRPGDGRLERWRRSTFVLPARSPARPGPARTATAAGPTPPTASQAAADPGRSTPPWSRGHGLRDRAAAVRRADLEWGRVRSAGCGPRWHRPRR